MDQNRMKMCTVKRPAAPLHPLSFSQHKVTLFTSFSGIPPGWWWWFIHQVMFDPCNPVDCSLPGFSVHGILQQGYWAGQGVGWSPFPYPGDLPDPGIEPRSPALQADSL